MNPYPNFGPVQPYPTQGLGALKRMSTKAKLLIAGAVAVVGVVIIAVLAGGMHGHGPSAFLSQLHDAGFYNHGGDSGELSDAYKICDWLGDGASHPSAAHSFWLYSPNLSYDDAAQFVDITDDYLC